MVGVHIDLGCWSVLADQTVLVVGEIDANGMDVTLIDKLTIVDFPLFIDDPVINAFLDAPGVVLAEDYYVGVTLAPPH